MGLDGGLVCGLVGAIGVAIAVAGVVGGWLSVRDTIVRTFGVRAVGTTRVIGFTDPPGKPCAGRRRRRANHRSARGARFRPRLHNSDRNPG